MALNIINVSFDGQNANNCIVFNYVLATGRLYAAEIHNGTWGTAYDIIPASRT